MMVKASLSTVLDTTFQHSLKPTEPFYFVISSEQYQRLNDDLLHPSALLRLAESVVKSSDSHSSSLGKPR